MILTRKSAIVTDSSAAVNDAGQLLLEIESLREQLHTSFEHLGLTSPIVLEKSQQLDELLNNYHVFLKQRNNQTQTYSHE
ncbi:aspartyl-phosphate phosphatase Spo0E family protein [Paenibacillus taihuensis]|uniref:aspartyl-phosphate phosphatase Spo0E family protein n=1 Tax=Paenibacillus taihuensis TaxID=1156355 RepID=UPI000E25B491|nr:aspartyl-phosphate phosphatase Spo0E family protein [Paenibacillus taihuensis]